MLSIMLSIKLLSTNMEDEVLYNVVSAAASVLVVVTAVASAKRKRKNVRYQTLDRRIAPFCHFILPGQT